MSRVGAVVVAVALLSGAGCVRPARTAPRLDRPEPFRIGQEDVLEISVWHDPELSRVMPVRPDGFISLPMAGEVLAAGKTPPELADEIGVRLEPYVQKPKVTVMVREIHSALVYVTGEVARPGSYPLRGRVSVLQAIALAGGLTDFANQDAILVLRRGERGGQIPVRYRELVSGAGKAGPRNEDSDVELIPGDTVVVP